MKRLGKNIKYTVAQNSLMNTLGVIVYYVCQWAVTMVTVRLTSGRNVGLLQLALTVSNLYTALANYNMRSYQVSDIRGEYKAGEYVASRVLTCVVAMGCCIFYSMSWGYGKESLALIAVYQIYRLTESFSDVLHGIDQLHDRMDHVSISFIIRGILMLTVYTIVLKGTDNLFLAITAMAAITTLVVVTYDIPISSRYEMIHPIFRGGGVWRLLMTCLPAMLSSMAFTAVVTIPRQVLREIEGEVLLGFYATVATPLVFMQVLLNGLVNPVLGKVAQDVSKKQKAHFLRLCGKMTAIPLVCGVLLFVGIMIAGKPIMTILYGEKIEPYIGLMYGVTGSTVGYCLGCIAMNILVVFRKMKTLLVISAVTLLFAVTTAGSLIRLFGADGVSICITGAYLVFTIAVVGMVWSWIQKWPSTKKG